MTAEVMATNRQERERELQQMAHLERYALYCRLYGLPPGQPPAPGALLIQGILAKEFPEEKPANSGGRGQET